MLRARRGAAAPGLSGRHSAPLDSRIISSRVGIDLKYSRAAGFSVPSVFFFFFLRRKPIIFCLESVIVLRRTREGRRKHSFNDSKPTNRYRVSAPPRADLSLVRRTASDKRLRNTRTAPDKIELSLKNVEKVSVSATYRLIRYRKPRVYRPTRFTERRRPERAGRAPRPSRGGLGRTAAQRIVSVNILNRILEANAPVNRIGS